MRLMWFFIEFIWFVMFDKSVKGFFCCLCSFIVDSFKLFTYYDCGVSYHISKLNIMDIQGLKHTGSNSHFIKYQKIHHSIIQYGRFINIYFYVYFFFFGIRCCFVFHSFQRQLYSPHHIYLFYTIYLNKFCVWYICTEWMKKNSFISMEIVISDMAQRNSIYE